MPGRNIDIIYIYKIFNPSRFFLCVSFCVVPVSIYNSFHTSYFSAFFHRAFAFHIVGYSSWKLKINKDKLLAIHWNFQKTLNIVVRIVKRKISDEISCVNIIKILLLTCVIESTLKSTTTHSEKIWRNADLMVIPLAHAHIRYFRQNSP